MNNHGGKRIPGPGKSLGPRPKHGVTKVPISGRVTPQVADFLRATGNISESIESTTRATTEFGKAMSAVSDLPDSTWASLIDGKQRVFEAGKDFAHGNQNSVRSQSHYEAKVRGFRSRTRTRGFDIVIQWFPLEKAS